MSESIHFSFDKITKIANEFSEEVGRGGYGIVYKGSHDGKIIAVKKLHALHGLDDKAFDSEFLNLSKVHHRNIVQLIGYCHESQRKFIKHNGQDVSAFEIERVLCFEFVEGGSLDKHISDESCDLDWPTCYGIVKGTCDGLNHLHNAYQGRKPIYHLDLKPANILLDNDMSPKIADLGLSKLVASTKTHRTEARDGTLGYMPPEYVDYGAVSPKFDVFSLGVIIIKIVDGNAGNFRRSHLKPEEFVERVTENWMERLQGTSRSSQEINILRVKKCVDIALSCVEDDRNKRPRIVDIVKELDQLEADIEKMSVSSDQSKGVIGQMRSSDSNVVAVDPTLELRFLFKPSKEISCILQLTNKTDGPIAYNIKTNQTKYRTVPNKGILPPCSRCYVCVTLRAQEVAPPNMQCHDMLLVQSVNVSEGLTSDQITKDFFRKLTEEKEKVVDVVTLPIVYVAPDQFPGCTVDNMP